MRIADVAFTLPWAPDSLNVLLRTHWSRRHRENGSTDLVVRASTRPADRTRRLALRVDFVIRRKRLLDEDNNAASIKPILDALVRTGVIFDDRKVQVTVRQEKARLPTTQVSVWWDDAAPLFAARPDMIA